MVSSDSDTSILYAHIDADLKAQLMERIKRDGRTVRGWTRWITEIYVNSQPGEIEAIQIRIMNRRESAATNGRHDA